MSEQERRWKNNNRKGLLWKQCPPDATVKVVVVKSGTTMDSCHTIESIEAHPNFYETFEHLEGQPAPIDPELTALRNFRTAVNEANRDSITFSKLSAAICRADDAVRAVVKTNDVTN